LLGVAQGLEQHEHRERRERWGPRTLDVDVLLVGDARVSEPDLVVPHPRLAERAFVLVPLADVAREWEPAARDRAGVRPAGVELRLPE
jgi:2-amino-4-hydroxy-6-hydroxymethyldihydropteridine diphosphokinase